MGCGYEETAQHEKLASGEVMLGTKMAQQMRIGVGTYYIQPRSLLLDMISNAVGSTVIERGTMRSWVASPASPQGVLEP